MKTRHNKSAFTLTEALISISIIMILSGISLVNYRSSAYQFSLLRSAYKLSQDIRRAQEMAVSAREFQGAVPPGYGIYLKGGDKSYLLYVDNNSSSGNQQYDGGDSVFQTLSFEKDVYIKEVTPSSVSINFKGPDPATTISGGVSSLFITLALESNPSKTQRVIVNKAGLIYVE